MIQLFEAIITRYQFKQFYTIGESISLVNVLVLNVWFMLQLELYGFSMLNIKFVFLKHSGKKAIDI